MKRKAGFLGLGILPIKLEGWKGEEKLRKHPKTPKTVEEAVQLMQNIHSELDHIFFTHGEFLVSGMQQMSEKDPNLKPQSKRITEIMDDLKKAQKEIENLWNEMPEWYLWK